MPTINTPPTLPQPTKMYQPPTSQNEFVQYDLQLKNMTDAMRYKLRINSHKGFIGNMDPKDLLAKLREEVDELEEAISRGSLVEIILEAADVANFALGAMIKASSELNGIKNNV